MTYLIIYKEYHQMTYQAIPQGNQLFHPSNLLTDHLKQTGIMEPLIADYFRCLCLSE